MLHSMRVLSDGTAVIFDGQDITIKNRRTGMHICMPAKQFIDGVIRDIGPSMREAVFDIIKQYAIHRDLMRERKVA